jgi:adenylylsulfate kinase-like enzyme
MFYVIPAGTKVTLFIGDKTRTTKLRQQLSFDEADRHDKDNPKTAMRFLSGNSIMEVSTKDMQVY